MDVISAKEGHRDYQRAGGPLLWGLAERDRVVQPGEEKPLGSLLADFQYLKGAFRYWKKSVEGLLFRECIDRTSKIVFKLKKKGDLY